MAASEVSYLTQTQMNFDFKDEFIEVNQRSLNPESLPSSRNGSISCLYRDQDGVFTDDKLEQLLLQRIEAGDKASRFQLGQFYFEREMYENAFTEFERIKDTDFQAKYQLGVMYYDGLGVQGNPAKGCEILKSICESKSKKAQSLVPFAQFNIGRAYYEGKGLKQSDDTAEHYWTIAARGGDPTGSVQAQSVLGMFYSRQGEPSYDLKKSYYWHQEACGNGNIESQGALGVMFEYGIGVERDVQSALECLKGASQQGNVYAQGNLAMHFYHQKLYNQAAEIARSVGSLEDVTKIAKVTNCLALYVAKGIAIGCFVYAVCLYRGHGLMNDTNEAMKWFRRCYHFDPETVARFHNEMTFGYL